MNIGSPSSWVVWYSLMPKLEVMNHKLYHEIIIRRSIPYAISTNKNAYVDDPPPFSGESLSHTCETFHDTSIILLKQTYFMQAITIPRAFTLHYFKHTMDHIFLFTLISSVLYYIICVISANKWRDGNLPFPWRWWMMNTRKEQKSLLRASS